MRRTVDAIFRYHLILVAGVLHLSCAYGLWPAAWREILAGAERKRFRELDLYRHLPDGLHGGLYALVLLASLLLFHRFYTLASADDEPAPGRGRARGNVTAGILCGFALTGALLHSGNEWLKPEAEAFREMRMKRACVSNLKTLEGATELYLMEHDVKMWRLLPLDMLMREGCLRSEPTCPAYGTYTIEIRIPATPEAAGTTIVECSAHPTDEFPGVL